MNKCTQCENPALESLVICEECLSEAAAKSAANMGSPFGTEEDACRFLTLNPQLFGYFEELSRKREV